MSRDEMLSALIALSISSSSGPLGNLNKSKDARWLGRCLVRTHQHLLSDKYNLRGLGDNPLMSKSLLD